MGLREQQAAIEDELAAREQLLADLDARVKKLLAQQARLDAAASARLARAAGVDLATIHGTPAQIAVVKETMKYLGIPYVWAGATPSGGFDCSGLVLYVYAKFGVEFPHGATMQAHMGDPVSLAQAQPADLVFFGYAGLLPPRGHLHRQRPVHRGAAHRRRGQGEPAGGPRLLAHLPVLHQPALTAAAPAAAHCRRPARRGRLPSCRGTSLLIVALASLALVIAVLVYARPQGVAAGQARSGRLAARHAARRRPRAQGGRDHRRRRAPLGRRRSSSARTSRGCSAPLARLQVIAQTVNDAMRPYWLIAGWLSGEKEWSDLGI